MRDIYELIHQKENEIGRFEKEIQRVHKELEALRVAAKLLDDSTDVRTTTVAAASVAREAQVYSPVPAARPASSPAPAPSPAAWASAKQFP